MSATSVELEETPVAQDLTKVQQAGSACQNDLRSSVERRARGWRNLGNPPAEPSQGRRSRRPVISPGDGWTVVLRRQPARMAGGRPEGGYSDAFELICCDCGDHPGLDYCEVAPELQRVRGSYPIAAGVAAYEKHLRQHRQPAYATRAGAMADAGDRR
jgi:hypothetical protein